MNASLDSRKESQCILIGGQFAGMVLQTVTNARLIIRQVCSLQDGSQIAEDFRKTPLNSTNGMRETVGNAFSLAEPSDFGGLSDGPDVLPEAETNLRYLFRSLVKMAEAVFEYPSEPIL